MKPATNPSTPKPSPGHALREQWLAGAVDILRPVFEKAGSPIPAKVRVTCGWPCTGGRGGKRQRIGECWDDTASASRHFEIFISPTQAEPLEVLAILAHELIHAAVGLAAGHKRPFADACKALLLEGKPTATYAGEAFTAAHVETLRTLGTYPHATLNPAKSGHKKQGTRSLRCKCPECGWAFRATQKWIDAGLPRCACGGQFIALDGAAAEEDGEEEE